MRLRFRLLSVSALCLLSLLTEVCLPGQGQALFVYEAEAASPSSSQFESFTITRFHVDIAVHGDSSIIVVESLIVDFPTQRHGIYRDIPFKYRDDHGKTRETPTEILSVTDQAGKKLQYEVTRPGSIVHVRIGNPKRYVSGVQTYVITYKVENVILAFDDHDELYWNVTGNYWKSAIREASATVTLTAKSTSRKQLTACYTGPAGSKQSECKVETYDNRAEFFCLRNLQPGEGLTVAFGWDKGLVEGPSLFKRLLWAVNPRENWVLLLPLLSLGVIARLWYTGGRDPKVREAVTVRYTPPEQGGKPLSPAEVGNLIDERLDPRDITSSIIGLAVGGYIRIEEEIKEGLIFNSTDYRLIRLKEPDDQLTPFEQQLMRYLFPDADSTLVSSLKNRFYAHLDSLRGTLEGELVRKGYFLKSPEKVKRLYVVAAIAVAGGGILLSSTILQSHPVKAVISWGLAGLVILAFSRIMPAKTRAGATARADVLGFQEFLNRAEKDRLERLNDPTLFTRFLPYAIALDVVENWSRAFEGVYQQPPEWYSSHSGFRVFSPSTFSHSINAATSSLSSALFSAPRGSGMGSGGGSGGGGSSGGGFGGGGGGSW